MKKSWWKVPLYCLVASWICFQLEIRVLGRFAIITLPDGAITSDQTRWMIMSGILFAMVVVIGGLLFFRGMTRKELFYSASVMVVLNILFGLILYMVPGMFALYWSEFTEWNSFIAQILFKMNLNNWIAAIIVWASPYLFILFGKRDLEKE